MILVGCKSEDGIIPCGECNLKPFPHRCNVFREENHTEKIYAWEWVETPESSNIETFAHEAGNMRVCFKNGTIYDYFEVPVKVFEEMKKAESKGKFLNANLRGKYRTQKLE
jgi:KTSC domain